MHIFRDGIDDLEVSHGFPLNRHRGLVAHRQERPIDRRVRGSVQEREPIHTKAGIPHLLDKRLLVGARLHDCYVVRSVLSFTDENHFLQCIHRFRMYFSPETTGRPS